MHAAPDSSKVDLDKIHDTPNVLGLVLTFHVSFAIAARKTAQILRQVFRIPISYQTVLNYAEAAAPYCHHFNLAFKGDIDDESSGDETYIKIAGKHAYVFFIYRHGGNHMRTLFLQRSIFNQRRKLSQLKDTTAYLDTFLQDFEEKQNVIQNVQKC